MWFFPPEFPFFLGNISFAQAHGVGEQQARSKDFGGSGDRIRKVERKRWTDKGWTVKRNELLPCRRRSVTDSSVFISFWHDILVSSSLIVSFDSSQHSISSTRVSRTGSSWAGSGKRTRKRWHRVVHARRIKTYSITCEWFYPRIDYWWIFYDTFFS